MNRMSAAACPSRLQRATGDLHVSMKLRDSTTVLADLRQEGCLKARFPRPVDWPEIITLNTSGGVAGGDRLRTTLAVRPGASATFAAQAAERFYRALPEDPQAHIRTTLTVAQGAAAEWLPQESILFDHCALNRSLDITLAPDAWFLGVESLVFGRRSMGETLTQCRLSDRIRITRGADLLLHDAIRLHGDASPLTRPALARGAGAVATLIHVAPTAESHLADLREAWKDTQAGVSAWNGLLLARILAPDAATLRHAVTTGLAILRDGRPLPRVWLC
jgi:urease accessory protein